MANMSIRSYAEDLGANLRGIGYDVQVLEPSAGEFLGTYSVIGNRPNGPKAFFQIVVERGPMALLGDYKLKLLGTDPEVLEDLDRANGISRDNTGTFNLEKREFHDRLDETIRNLANNFDDYKVPVERGVSIHDALGRSGYHASITEKLGIGHWVKPAIGLEFDDGEIHPVFGIAVGGNRFGGLLLYDPIDGQVEAGGYLGFGGFGVGGISELGTPGELLGDKEPGIGGLEEALEEGASEDRLLGGVGGVISEIGDGLIGLLE